MARGRTRARARHRTRRNVERNGNRTQVGGGVSASLIPRVVLRVVDGAEIVAVGALQLARDVAVSAVSGAATIGTEAVTATVAGARAVVSATSQMIGNIAGTAQGTLQATVTNIRRSGRGTGRPSLVMADTSRSTAMSTSFPPAGARRGKPRLRVASRRPSGPSIAA